MLELRNARSSKTRVTDARTCKNGSINTIGIVNMSDFKMLYYLTQDCESTARVRHKQDESIVAVVFSKHVNTEVM